MTTEEIKIRAKREFLYDAEFWDVGNKAYEVIFIISIGVLGYAVYTPIEPGLLFSAVLGLSFYFTLWSNNQFVGREGEFIGYFKGFQEGYEAARSGSYFNEFMREEDCNAERIERSIEKGASYAKGLFFNRKNIYNDTPWRKSK